MTQDAPATPTRTVRIPIAQILADPALQMRADRVDPNQMQNLAEAIDQGATLPPIVVYQLADEEVVDNQPYILADGWHRYYTWLHHAKAKQVAAEVHPGGREGALLYALGANADHGLRRTNRDKRRAVLTALEKWPKWSNRKIAETCRVSHQFVNKLQAEVATVANNKDPNQSPDTSEPQQIDWWDRWEKLNASDTLRSASMIIDLDDPTFRKAVEQDAVKGLESLKLYERGLVDARRLVRERIDWLTQVVAADQK